MGTLLTDADEYTHLIGSQQNWNESRYLDFWDREQRVGGWFRIGNRPNEGRAEMSACINLPDGRTAFMFDRPNIVGNTLKAGDLGWNILEPWRRSSISYHGDLLLLDDAWLLTNPKKAFQSAPRLRGDVELVSHSFGLESIMGSDQDHIDLIFLPGQADFHYQNLTRTTGTVRLGADAWTIAGRGCADHSWGPRNWHAKIYLRWIIASIDDSHGFMLVRGVGPNKQTRGGFVWENGHFSLVDDFQMQNTYGAAPNYPLKKCSLVLSGGGRSWCAVGIPQDWLPLRHQQISANGEPALLRIVKSPTEWVVDGRAGVGMCEWHDLMEDGKPVGLHD